MTFTLIDGKGRSYESDVPGTLGGHRRNRVYGRLDCRGARRWIAKGHYVSNRVFFADEATAVAAGYRPCAGCMPEAYAEWKARRADRVFSVHESPVGPLLLSGDELALTGLTFLRREKVPEGWRRDDERFRDERRGLDRYFAGEATTFDFPVRFEGGGEFEREVWEALRAIPYGTTTTYGALAAELGDPGAARAVGAANGRNPIAIVVPCHRVVGAGGKLTGYGGGLDRKRALLELEGSLLPV
jgi:methylated-DNA-[protein]-cysteine S-methyltransferase